MKRFLFFAILIIAFSASPAFAWNCTTPVQVRVQVPTGTLGNGTGDGSGQVVVDNGLTFICESLPTAGASATGGQGGTSSSTSNAAGGTSSSTQTQSSTATAASSGGNNSNNTNVAAPQIPVSSAYAPTSLPSAPCLKGFGIGVQSQAAGVSFGGSKVDAGCDERELARSYALLGSRLAACKILITSERSQKAGVTIDDCLGPVPVAAVPAAVLAPAAMYGGEAMPESLGDIARRYQAQRVQIQ